MHTRIVIHPKFNQSRNEILKNIEHIGDNNNFLFIGKRNIIKKAVDSNYKNITIKCFKTPNFINQIAYGIFRSSKAKRSYHNALKLIKLGFLTPEPIGYIEYQNFLFYKKGYYLSELLDYEAIFRDLIIFENYPDKKKYFNSLLNSLSCYMKIKLNF